MHFHQQCMRIPNSPHPQLYTALPVFAYFRYFNGCVLVSYCGFNLHYHNVAYLFLCFLRMKHLYVCFDEEIFFPISIDFVFNITEFWGLVLHFGYKFFIRYVVCKYFLSVAYLFLLLTMSFKKQMSEFWWNPILIIFINGS